MSHYTRLITANIEQEWVALFATICIYIYINMFHFSSTDGLNGMGWDGMDIENTQKARVFKM